MNYVRPFLLNYMKLRIDSHGGDKLSIIYNLRDVKQYISDQKIIKQIDDLIESLLVYEHVTIPKLEPRAQELSFKYLTQELPPEEEKELLKHVAQRKHDLELWEEK